MDALPSFPNFTPDERVWRLDWFGECAYPPTIRRYAQPSIKVVFSPLRCDPSDHTALLQPDSTDHSHQRETWAPVAALPLLAIGDLWQDGHQIASPDYQVETFKGLSVQPETASFVKAGLAIDEHFLLPLNHHPWHRLHTHAYCVAIALDEHRRLLVPCLEIIRFYFGSSSNLVQRLFSAPLTQETLWTSKSFNAIRRHLHLVLASRLSGASASDIGRIAESKLAWRAAAGIHASCQKASVVGQPIYAYTGFPFEGGTDLVASGVWLPFGDQQELTFLAYRLRSCSHPFPFRSLSYEATDRKARPAPSGDRQEPPKKFGRAKPRTQKTEVAETDPSAYKTQRSRSFAAKHRFPDLIRKQVWREKVETMQSADVFLLRSDGGLEQVAVGESGRLSNTAGVDVSQETTCKGTPSLPWFVQTALAKIAKDPAYTTNGGEPKLVCPTGKQTLIFSLPVVIDEDGVIAGSLLFSAPDGHTRQRRGCFVEVAGQSKLITYLLILEGRVRSERPTLLPAATSAVDAELITRCQLSAA